MNKTYTFVVPLLGLLLAGSANVGRAQCTIKSGTIVGEIWTRAGSPYCIVGNISVASLTIEPGVRVVFNGNYVFEVAGNLQAVGSSIDSIYFIKADTLPANRGWQGIFFNNTRLGSQLRYCRISGSFRSGIRIDNSNPVIRNCMITGNQSANSGGGIRISLNIPDDVEVSDCIISNNSTLYDYTLPPTHGAGVFVINTADTVRFVNCIIQNNLTRCYDGEAFGGGCRINGNVRFIRCTIQNNRADGTETIPGGASTGSGGGIFIDNGFVLFANSIIKDNTAYGYGAGGMSGSRGYATGGGIHIGNGTIRFANSVISRNIATSTHGTQGGGIFVNSGQTLIENSTLVRNNVHGIERVSGTVSVVNSILYFNNLGSDTTQVRGTVAIAYSDVQQRGISGLGNINENPILNDETGCFQIVPPSRCIDAGDTTRAYNDVCFVSGNRRRSWGSSRNDMGAHGGPGACGWDSSQLCIVTAVENPISILPKIIALSQNYPNPFNPETRIKYQIPNSSHVTLKVFDLLGREVATLVNESLQPGTYEASFDGSRLASGVYLYRLQAGGFVQTRKLLLLK